LGIFISLFKTQENQKDMKKMKLAGLVMWALLLVSMTGCKKEVVNYTRGIGVYPGDAAEDYSPVLVADHDTYRNIALLRPVWNSSSYDYNLTAQLVTDGIITGEAPCCISVSTNNGMVSRGERELLFDDNFATQLYLGGPDCWIQLDKSPAAPKQVITRVTLKGGFYFDQKKPEGWRITCQGSNDGVQWDDLQTVKGSGLPGQEKINPFAPKAEVKQLKKTKPEKKPASPAVMGPYGNDSTAPKPSFTYDRGAPQPERSVIQDFNFTKPVSYRFYRVTLSAPCVKVWYFSDLEFYNNGNRLNVLPSLAFRSAWMSAGANREWVYVDFGNESTFDHIKLYWINKAIQGSLQVSDDAKTWADVTSLPGGGSLIDDIKLATQAKGRYLRVLMQKAAGNKPYILSEMEVFGKGGMVAKPKPSPAITGNRMLLDGGNWTLQRSSLVSANGEEISKTGYQNKRWIVATVPGTVLTSYLNIGALPDPNFGDNQVMISESFFCSDFWYRDEFDVPANYSGDRMFLNFDGINWKAEVFVNGQKAGNIDGAFTRGKFDVTCLIKPGTRNALAVRIIKNDHFGAVTEQDAEHANKNGGILGADNPTFHASIGWDWIPTIRGRNIGIWNDVYLQVTGAVTLADPFVYTRLNLPDTTEADVNAEVTLQNHNNKAVEGTLYGKFGDIAFDEKVFLGPSETRTIKLNSGTHPSLHLKNPKLWWPKGYGAQYLYDVTLKFSTADGKTSDEKTFNTGVREMTFTENNDILNLYINGRRFIGRGGNWGFPESNLNYRGREYDAAVAYHADMNFTMIRNWVGQTADDEFFEACDKYGVMVWQDFWLANPWDGPDPYNPAMFMSNAADFVKRIRNHPSIGLYVGRNEGNPPEVIDTALKSLIARAHPGVHYIPNSASGVVSGGGPYRALPVRDYYLLYGYNKFHSERGMPNVMTYESMLKTFPDSALWPQNSQWGLHDYCLQDAMSAASFNALIEKGFGKANNLKEFTELAQWINYNGYRGMFEGRSMYRQGLLLWMSHPAWPSMVWQTYDYFLEPTAAYFGCKKANEPIHIQWNPVFNDIEVVNYSAGNHHNLSAKAQIFNMDGSLQWEKEIALDCKEDFTVTCFRLQFPATLSAVHFILLTLEEDKKEICRNFYWRGLEDGNYKALRNMPRGKLDTQTHISKTGDGWVLTTRLSNTGSQPVLMIRLKVTGKRSGERILPVFYSDNYISLMPGEQRDITMRLKDQDTRGEKPQVEISGFNL
jgi:hypothetical protein